MTDFKSRARKLIPDFSADGAIYVSFDGGLTSRKVGWEEILEKNIATALQEAREEDIAILVKLKDELLRVEHHTIAEEIWRVENAIKHLREEK